RCSQLTIERRWGKGGGLPASQSSLFTRSLSLQWDGRRTEKRRPSFQARNLGSKSGWRDAATCNEHCVGSSQQGSAEQRSVTDGLGLLQASRRHGAARRRNRRPAAFRACARSL